MSKCILFVGSKEAKSKLDKAENINLYDIRVDKEEKYKILHMNLKEEIGFVIPSKEGLYTGYCFTELTNNNIYYGHY